MSSAPQVWLAPVPKVVRNTGNLCLSQVTVFQSPEGWDRCRWQGHSDRTVTSWQSSFSAFPTLTSFLNRTDKTHNNEEKLLISIWISVLDRPVLFHIA